MVSVSVALMRGCASGGSNAAKPGKTPGRTPRGCPRPRRYCRQRDKTVPKQSRGSPFQCCLAKPQYPCACKNNAHSLLQQILWRLCQCGREGCSASAVTPFNVGRSGGRGWENFAGTKRSVYFASARTLRCSRESTACLVSCGRLCSLSRTHTLHSTQH